MTACGTDYLSKEWLSRSYILIYSVFCYFMPLLLIIYSYFFIVQVEYYFLFYIIFEFWANLQLLVSRNVKWTMFSISKDDEWFQAVAAHEKGMREQAKKMNVASLRSSEAANTSAECKLAKVGT